MVRGPDKPLAERTGTGPISLGLFEHEVPVQLIATPRATLHLCSVDQPLAEVLAAADGRDYHVLPVTRPDDGRTPIVGLLDLAPYRRGDVAAAGRVADAVRPLTEDDLIGADAGILAYIREADRHGTRLVVSGPAISGIVTLSDIQRLPARACLFAMVTHLEMVMADAIRAEFGGGDGWRDRLSDGRQAKVAEKADLAGADGVAGDTLQFTEIVDKLDIITGRPGFPWSRKSTTRAFDPIIALRDRLAHANVIAATREAAHAVCATVREIDLWIARLNESEA